MEIQKNSIVAAENILYFVEPKELMLDKPDIHAKISTTKNGYLLTLSSYKLAKNIYVDFENTDVMISDNFFDLLPAEQKTIELKSVLTIEELNKKLKLKSLIDSY